jgi:hypothetical protein
MKHLLWILLASTSCMRVVHENQLPAVETRDGPPSASSEGPTAEEMLAQRAADEQQAKAKAEADWRVLAERRDASDCDKLITHVLTLKPHAPKPDPALGSKRCGGVQVAVRDCVMAATSEAEFDRCNAVADAADCVALADRYVYLHGSDAVTPGEAAMLRDECQKGVPKVVVSCALVSKNPEGCMDPMLRLQREENDGK